jgi:hypothetical protein
VSGKARGKVLDVGKTMAIASETTAKESAYVRSRAISNGDGRILGYCVDFEDARCKLPIFLANAFSATHEISRI